MRTKTTFHGVLRPNPANPRYFTDDTGKAVYLTGSHTWAVMQSMWPENEPRHDMDYDGFLQMLEDNGHNFLRFWQWMQAKNANWNEVATRFDPPPFARTGPGTARDGLPKFDLRQWNDAYFERLRERVEKAGEKGIYVSIMMFEAWGIKWATAPENDPWVCHPMNPQNNINELTDDPVVANGRAWNFYSLHCPQLLHWQQAFVKKVIDTVNDLDHVLYEISNEMPHTQDAMNWSERMCAFIRECEQGKPKQHPIGITAEGGDQDNAELFATSADWISPSNGRLFEYRYNPSAADGRKVLLNDTDHLWGHGGEIGWIWKSFTRGMNVLFMDPWEPIPGDLDGWQDGDISRNQRYYHAWDPLRRNLGYTRRYALRMDLNRCLPHGELCTSTFCLADPGREYLAFLPTGGPEGLDLWAAAGEFATEWFNPVTGVRILGGKLKGRQRHAVQAPFAGAAVLYLRR